MTSAPLTNGAQSSAQRIISAAPTEKFGATTAFTPPVKLARRRSRSDSPKPVVPQTACTPCSAHHCRLRRAASATVKSTLTSARASARASADAPISSPLPRQPAASSSWRPAAAGSTAATSSRSGAASTAAQTVAPIRPAAPKTPTRIIGFSYVKRPVPARGAAVEAEALGEVRLLERPDDGQCPRSREHPLGNRSDLELGHSGDPLQQFLDAEHVVEQQQPGAYSRHPRTGVLQRQEQVRTEVALCHLELSSSDSLGSQAVELGVK